MSYEALLTVGKKLEKIQIPFKNVSIGHLISSVPNVLSTDEAVKRSLYNILGNVDLASLNRYSKVVLVCDDYTRPTPTSDILPPIISFLNQKGVKDENISILIAAGFHREMSDEEKIAKYGEYVFKNFKIYHHDALDDKLLQYLGTTIDKVPVYINSLAVEADFLVGVGVVEIHPWAGFAGGGKIICPGIAGKKTINYLHSLPVIKDNVDIAITRGNPFWENIMEASKMAGLDMIVNVVLNNNEQVCGVFSGEPEAVQNECIKLFKSFNEIVFDEPADIVITTADPKYQYWGQSVIAGCNASRVVKKGGTRIILASCPEDFGDSQREKEFYIESLQEKWEDLQMYWEKNQGELFDNSRNACAVHRHLKNLKYSDMIMVTHNSIVASSELKSQPCVRTFDEAIKIVQKKYSHNASVIVFDMGGMVLCSIKQ